MQDDLFLEERATPPAADTAVERGPAVEIKGSVFTLLVLRLKRCDFAAIEQELGQRISQSKTFFEYAPVVLDLEHLERAEDGLDFGELCQLLRSLSLVPVGVRQGSEVQQRAAVEAGLAVLKGGAIQETVAQESRSGSAAKPVVVPSKALVVEQPVRSGQQVYAQGGDLIVLAPVNAGAEVIADGNIHIYAPLRGRALAGVLGDSAARIIAQSMEAELVSIAGHYQIFEERLAEDLFARPAQVYLKEMTLTLEPLR